MHSAASPVSRHDIAGIWGCILLKMPAIVVDRITLASDQSENLSFLNKLGLIPPGGPPQPGLTQPPKSALTYDSSKAYVTILISDGDNIAEDWATLRPMLEERVNSGTKTPVGWTISNRWMQWGAPVLRWAYAQGRDTGLDSFLMGPSGYGYLFPGNETREKDKEWFVNATVGAAEALGMEGYIHWDVDLFMDNATTNRTIELIKRYEGTAIKGVFQLASDPLGSKTQSPTFVGSLPVFKPIYQCLPRQAFFFDLVTLPIKLLTGRAHAGAGTARPTQPSHQRRSTLCSRAP